MEPENIGNYISKIVFNDNTEIEVGQNDIMVFVGPNNAGKSQALKDIYKLSERNVNPGVVVKNLSIKKSTRPYKELLSETLPVRAEGDMIHIDMLGRSSTVPESYLNSFQNLPTYEILRDAYVLNLTTEQRLSTCNPPSNTTRNGAKTHPIHYAEYDPERRKWLSSSFKKAFGTGLTPFSQFGAIVPLAIGEPVRLDGEYDDEQLRQEAYAEKLDKYPQAQDQGDGIKSFTGILLSLMLGYHRTYLIDEPESFLHPPQARIMGRAIGERLSDFQQAFISTHSEEILKGLLDSAPNRVKIIRITRDSNTNDFKLLSNEEVKAFWKDPLLKH